MTDMHLPKYRQIANAVRDRIHSGVYAPGERIPAEPALCTEFGVDRSTVRNAIAVLRREGLIDVEHGRGTFVRERRVIRRNLIESLRLEHEMAGREEEPDTGLFKALTGAGGTVDVFDRYDWLQAPPDVAEALGVPEGAALLRRYYLHIVDGEPHQVTHSYLPAALVEGTPLADRACERPGRGTIGQLASIGVRVDRIELDLFTRLASPEDIDALGMREGEPVMGYRLVTYAAGRPVEVADVVSPGEQIRQEITVDFGGTP